MNFAYIESPQFEYLSRSFQIASDQQTPEITGIYRDSTVLLNFCLDHRKLSTAWSARVDTCFEALDDSIIRGPKIFIGPKHSKSI